MNAHTHTHSLLGILYVKYMYNRVLPPVRKFSKLHVALLFAHTDEYLNFRV